jgi:hypothetical protein
MADSAVAPVDREGAAKETEIEPAKPESTATRQIADPLPNRDRPGAATVLGERRMVVMVAVDEPHFDPMRRERQVDVIEKPVASDHVGEVPEVTNLDDQLTLVGRRKRGQIARPARVPMSVAGDKDALQTGSACRRLSHRRILTVKRGAPAMSFWGREATAAHTTRSTAVSEQVGWTIAALSRPGSGVRFPDALESASAGAATEASGTVNRVRLRLHP